MTENENVIVEDFDKKENLIDNNQNKKLKNIIIIAFICFIIILIVVLILIFTVFKKDDNTEDKEEKKEEKYDDYTSLDTIPSEEFEKARKSFKQLNYTDEVTLKIIQYNLFIPEGYNNEKNEKYPLIIFISDKSLVGKEIIEPLTKTIGGPIWATDTEQKKHKSFVLVPQYNESIASREPKSEYVNATIRLIRKLQEEFPNIDSKRIYGTGQSMGGMVTLYLLANQPDLFAAGLIADGHWPLNELYGLCNATFTFYAAEGDPNPYNCQNEVKQYFDSNNIAYGNLVNLNAQEKVEKLNNDAIRMFNLGLKRNFITYGKGTVFPPGVDGKNEHMASFKYDYRIDAVRDWIFNQTLNNEFQLPLN